MHDNMRVFCQPGRVFHMGCGPKLPWHPQKIRGFFDLTHRDKMLKNVGSVKAMTHARGY